MKIDAKVLKEFVEEVEVLTQECIIKFEEEGISVVTMSTDNVGMIINKLSKLAFTDYDIIGEIAIDNLSLFKNFLARFGDENLTIVKKENTLNFETNGKHNLSGEFILVSSDYVKSINKIPDLKYETIITIDSKIIKDVVANAEILDKDFSAVEISVKDKVLTFSTGDTNKLKEIVNLDKKYKDVTVKLGEYLGKCIKFFDGEVLLKIGTAFPLVIEQKTDKKRLSYIIAPRVDDE